MASVNIVLNSNNALNGSTTQKATYFVDWRALLNPYKKYYCHFVYLGGLNEWDGTKIATIYANFNTKNIQPANGSTSSTQLMGVLMPVAIAHGANASVILQSLDNTNLPIYLETPPSNNNLVISIFDNAATPEPYVDTASPTPAMPAAYVLTLRFTEVDDSDM